TLERFARYHRGAPYINEITFRFYSTTTEALAALENRHIEGIAFIPKDQVATYTGGPWQLYSPSLPQITGLFFNLKKEYVEDRRVREALGYATNKEALLQDVLNGHASVANSMYLSHDAQESPLENPTPYDPEKAKAILAELKFSPDGTHLPVTLTTVEQPETMAVANAIAAQWKAVGVDVTVKTIDSAGFREQVLKDRAYDILLFGTLYGADPDPYPFWHSSQATHPGLNLSQYANRKADDLIEKGRKESDEAVRAETYRALAEMINETLPAIFLYQPTYSYVTSGRIRGIDLNSIVVPADRFGQVHEWYLKKRYRMRFTKEI
ncbi:ABC transporter substrate-binding protein, partial [Candidatus Uhrbacteria bacterium]|nr:ABC transporter substrate-binding protein [Candidatus Uhrbacteria bacterium]